MSNELKELLLYALALLESGNSIWAGSKVHQDLKELILKEIK